MNLGFWPADERKAAAHDYADACRELASRVGDYAGVRQGDVVVDAGCGRGDSLVEWLGPRFRAARVVGVNASRRECDAARALVERSALADRVRVVEGDAVVEVERLPLPWGGHERVDVVVSVDAAYHFHTREAFFAAARKTGARTVAASDICLSRAWEASPLTVPRKAVLWLISRAAGVPWENIVSGPLALARQLVHAGWHDPDVVVVTDRVLVPFSAHCLFRVRSNSLRKLGLSRWFTLWSSGWFMRWLAWTGAVDVVMYRAKEA